MPWPMPFATCWPTRACPLPCVRTARMKFNTSPGVKPQRKLKPSTMNSQPNPTPKPMVLYFQAHQPWRLRPFHFFEIGSQSDGFDNAQNEAIVRRVTRQCYVPANKILLDLIKKFPQLKITFSISGTLLDQLKQYCPEGLASFEALAETGSVEFLAETDFHSLASLLPGTEFEEQVLDHVARL